MLDTNALLWLLNDDVKLSAAARGAIKSASEIVISEVSLWEVSIKVNVGKIAPIPSLLKTVQALDFRRLNMKDDHLIEYEALPLIHRDPFDRMLIAQAVVEDLTILTSDNLFSQYDVKILNANG